MNKTLSKKQEEVIKQMVSIRTKWAEEIAGATNDEVINYIDDHYLNMLLKLKKENNLHYVTDEGGGYWISIT